MSIEVPTSLPIRRSFQETFYVPPHPLLIIPIPYGLFLVFAAWLDTSLIPETWPLGALAVYLGKNYNGLIALLAIFAGIVHVLESFWALYLSAQNGFTRRTTILWWFNGLAYGIFGLWPLVFPDFFNEIDYCSFSPCVNFKSTKYQQ